MTFHILHFVFSPHDDMLEARATVGEKTVMYHITQRGEQFQVNGWEGTIGPAPKLDITGSKCFEIGLRKDIYEALDAANAHYNETYYGNLSVSHPG